MIQKFYHKGPLLLENGTVVPQFHLAYSTYGTLNERGDNVVWIFHALTANSDAADWWSGLVGEGKFFDPSRYFIVCVNMPGSCYGSISPLDVVPISYETYYHQFPQFTTRDMVHAYQKLKQFLGIHQIFAGIGSDGYNVLK